MDARANRAAAKRRRQATAKKLVWDFFCANPCPCGESDPVVLEAHHPDPSVKTGNIADFMAAGNLKRLRAEMAIVVSRCCNCHRRETLMESGAFRHRWALVDVQDIELTEPEVPPQALVEDINMALAAHDLGY